MLDALLIPALALANRLAGRDGVGGKGLVLLIPALVACGTAYAGGQTLTNAAIRAGIVYLGLLAWRSPGTGTSFILVHRDLSEDPNPDRFGKLAARLVGTDNVLRYGLLVGFLRGSIPSIPLFFALELWHGAIQYAPVYSLLSGLSWVACYWWAGRKREEGAVERAEWINGGAMGVLVWSCGL